MAQDKMEVRAIENGTVIDHIPAESLFKIIKILQLDRERNMVTFGYNLDSKRMGSKAIIKISGRYCLPEEINRIALVAPHAKVNIIRNFEVIEKLHVRAPREVDGFVKCANPRCITNNEPVSTFFTVSEGTEIALKCRYCEKTTRQSQLEILR